MKRYNTNTSSEERIATIYVILVRQDKNLESECKGQELKSNLQKSQKGKKKALTDAEQDTEDRGKPSEKSSLKVSKKKVLASGPYRPRTLSRPRDRPIAC